MTFTYSQLTHPVFCLAFSYSSFTFQLRASSDRPSMTPLGPLSLFSLTTLCVTSLSERLSKCIRCIQCLWFLLLCELQGNREHFCFVYHCMFGVITMPGTEDVLTTCSWEHTYVQLLQVRVGIWGEKWWDFARACGPASHWPMIKRNFLQLSENMDLYWVTFWILTSSFRKASGWYFRVVDFLTWIPRWDPHFLDSNTFNVPTSSCPFL